MTTSFLDYLPDQVWATLVICVIVGVWATYKMVSVAMEEAERKRRRRWNEKYGRGRE